MDHFQGMIEQLKMGVICDMKLEVNKMAPLPNNGCWVTEVLSKVILFISLETI